MRNLEQQRARAFRDYWMHAKGSEKGEDQTFWNALLGEVLGVADLKEAIQYQVPVQVGGMRGAMSVSTKFLDAWIPATRVLVEHKSRGVKLDAPQPGHDGMTPFEQAKFYDDHRPFDEKARWIVICNFDEIWVYDQAKPLNPPEKIALADLPKDVHRLAFLAHAEVKKIERRELEMSVQAGRIVGSLYDALLKQYAAPEEPETLKALNKLCVRLVFCFYAEDAGIWGKNVFRKLVAATPASSLRVTLLRLFHVLNTPPERRDPYLEPELAVFPYTNGGLYRGATEAEIPPLTEEVKLLLVGSSDFDWSGIDTTIFGALFESTLNPVTRRSGGMVYTSGENIHKLIDPLFMDDLWRRFHEIEKGIAPNAPLAAKTRRQLLELQNDIASLTFLDPASGSGNFLTETYMSLRRLENRIIASLQQGQAELDLGIQVKVSIDQFRGIEINDFAVTVAKTAMWISEAKMLHETATILQRDPNFLPLKDYDGIIEGNALRLDWPAADYIIGNPPFRGARQMGTEDAAGSAQKADVLEIFKGWKNVGNLDYVTCWYKKAADVMAAGTGTTRAAFVSTNSICQGDGVATLWKPLFEMGIEIDFAWRTFQWNSESFEKAHVHCVIVGFHCRNEVAKSAKVIFDERGVRHEAKRINAYLAEAPDVFAESRRRPVDVQAPELVFGSMPNDGGYLSDWNDERKNAVVAKYPIAEQMFHPLLGSNEAINGISRWCLWLKGVSPALIRAVPPILEAVEKVRALRLASNRAATRKLADSPTLFAEIRQPENGAFLLIPKVSSERRTYVPMAFLNANVIVTDLAFILPHATLYHFGVLTSSVHMAWMRTVAGRLEMRYRYSAAIVYNNFPWPGFNAEPADVQEVEAAIAATAQSVLDARALYPDSSLADLYDPLTMPPELRKAHAANDAAVMRAYGFPAGLKEPEIVARLFELYVQCVSAQKGAAK